MDGVSSRHRQDISDGAHAISNHLGRMIRSAKDTLERLQRPRPVPRPVLHALPALHSFADELYERNQPEYDRLAREQAVLLEEAAARHVAANLTQPHLNSVQDHLTALPRSGFGEISPSANKENEQPAVHSSPEAAPFPIFEDQEAQLANWSGASTIILRDGVQGSPLLDPSLALNSAAATLMNSEFEQQNQYHPNFLRNNSPHPTSPQHYILKVDESPQPPIMAPSSPQAGPPFFEPALRATIIDEDYDDPSPQQPDHAHEDVPAHGVPARSYPPHGLPAPVLPAPSPSRLADPFAPTLPSIDRAGRIYFRDHQGQGNVRRMNRPNYEGYLASEALRQVETGTTPVVSPTPSPARAPSPTESPLARLSQMRAARDRSDIQDWSSTKIYPSIEEDHSTNEGLAGPKNISTAQDLSASRNLSTSKDHSATKGLSPPPKLVSKMRPAHHTVCYCGRLKTCRECKKTCTRGEDGVPCIYVQMSKQFGNFSLSRSMSYSSLHVPNLTTPLLDGFFCKRCVALQHIKRQYLKERPAVESEPEATPRSDASENEEENRSPSNDGATTASDDAVTNHLVKSRAKVSAVAARLRRNAQEGTHQAPRPAAPLAAAPALERNPAPKSSPRLPKMGSFATAGTKRRREDEDEADDEGNRAQQGRRKLAKTRPPTAATADFLPMPPARESTGPVSKRKRSCGNEDDETEEEAESHRGRRKMAKMRQPTAAVASFFPMPSAQEPAGPVVKRKRSQGEDHEETEEEVDGGRGRKKIARTRARRTEGGKQ